jgi:nucleoside-diphosphate-sugar epimerase
VIFGEGNKGNVYNLLRQLATGRFFMVGKGMNRKSMAYVGNLVEFLARLADADQGVHVFNYADKPDLTMSQLLRVASEELDLRLPRWTLPYRAGLAAGYVFDLLALITGRKFPLSSVRVRKFCAETTVNTERLASTGFVAPFSLEEGLRRMIEAEFPGSPRTVP